MPGKWVFLMSRLGTEIEGEEKEEGMQTETKRKGRRGRNTTFLHNSILNRAGERKGNQGEKVDCVYKPRTKKERKKGERYRHVVLVLHQRCLFLLFEMPAAKFPSLQCGYLTTGPLLGDRNTVKH
jgi:hypothetical protein